MLRSRWTCSQRLGRAPLASTLGSRMWPPVAMEEGSEIAASTAAWKTSRRQPQAAGKGYSRQDQEPSPRRAAQVFPETRQPVRRNRRGRYFLTKLAKTKMAKSVYDAGWSQLKTMLEYQCAHAGIVFKVVRETNTTRACSSCWLSGPQGVNGLRVRFWECVECGVLHDRDVNAAPECPQPRGRTLPSRSWNPRPLGRGGHQRL